MQAAMADMQGKMNTLLGLLGAPLRKAAGIDHNQDPAPDAKAG